MTIIRRRHRRGASQQATAVRVRFAPLPPEDIVAIRGLPTTSMIRTLIDLAGDLSQDEAIRITRQALARDLVSLDELRHAAATRNDVPSIDRFRLVMRDIEGS